MPYSNVAEAESRNPGIKTLSSHAKTVWVAAFNNAKNSGKDDATAAKIAWAAAQRTAKNDEDRWVNMEEVLKANIEVDGDSLAFGIPFTKIDVKSRTVEGFATLDNVDKANEVVDFEASKVAFADWLGNIREMHGPKAVGKALSVEEKVLERNGTSYRGIWVKARISKGAQDTWEKIVDGTYNGFSIGGKVLERKPEVVKSDEDSRYQRQMVHRITKYHLAELSVVDNPMNPLALFDEVSKNDAKPFASLVKSDSGNLEATDVIIEEKGLFYCETCDIAKTDDMDAKTVECITCDAMMVKIGEVSEAPGISDLKKFVDAYRSGETIEKAKKDPESPSEDAAEGGEAHEDISGSKLQSHMQQTHDMPSNASYSNGQMQARHRAMHQAQKVLYFNDYPDNENNDGLGMPNDDTGNPVPMETPNQNLLTQESLPQPQANPSLVAQKTEGNSESVTVSWSVDDPNEMIERFAIALKSRVESLGSKEKHREIENPEEFEFVEAMMDADLFRAVTNAHKTPPKGKPSDSSQYADPANFKYPVDSPARVRAAMVYFNHPGQREAGGYSMSQWAVIGRKIASAANAKFGAGHSYSNGKVVGPNTSKLDFERGEVIINLQKNDTDVNNGIVDLLKNLVNFFRKDDSPSIEGGETKTLDVKELEKILDILDVASNEIKEVLKGFNVQQLNSENASGPTVGGGNSGGIGTEGATGSVATAEVEVAQAVSLPGANGATAGPDQISTDGTGAHSDTAVDAGPDKVVPDNIKSDETEEVKVEETVEETVKADDPADLVKSALGEVMKAFDEKFSGLTDRMTAIENSGGTKKSAEVAGDELKKSETSIWGGSFYSGELEKE